MSIETKVGAMYDHLSRFEVTDETDAQTVHKRLKFPAEWQARGVVDINDWLGEQLTIGSDTRLLDAGCGCGATLFSLLGAHGNGIGLSLSENQVAIAQRWAETHNLQNRIQFRQQSYNDPIDQQVDIITAIEALVHSRDLTTTFNALAQSLAPNGEIWLVEDIAADEGGKLGQIMQESWSFEKVYTDADFTKAIGAASLIVAREFDLTEYVLHKRQFPSSLLSLAHTVTKHTIVPKIFIGGFALEELYRKGLMRYRCLVVKHMG